MAMTTFCVPHIPAAVAHNRLGNPVMRLRALRGLRDRMTLQPAHGVRGDKG
jgi:hypothetical protein